MGTITQETAGKIWSCHREIEASKKLQQELAEARKWREDPTPLDAYGRRSGFELGVPSGKGSHRLYNVPVSLMPYCLDVHIAAQEKELAEACVMAQMELDGLAPAEKNVTPMQVAAE